MSRDGRSLGASADMPDMRPCWLLRLIEEQACDQTLSCHAASDHTIVSAGRGLALVLYRRDHVLGFLWYRQGLTAGSGGALWHRSERRFSIRYWHGPA